MNDVNELIWEPEETTKGKVQHLLTFMVSGTTYQDKLDSIPDIPIVRSYRLGRYKAMRNRPVIIEFANKTDVDYVTNNRTHLPRGVFVDYMYSDATEAEHRKLKPILWEARIIAEYKGKCKLVANKLIIKRKNVL